MFYVYDGSFEGFLSALTVVMRRHSGISDTRLPFYGILHTKNEPVLVEHQSVSVIPDILPDFGRYIRNHFGDGMVKTIYHAFLSEKDGIEDAIAEYVFIARKQRRDPIDQLYLDPVRKVAEASKLVTFEAHKYLGLLRFRKLRMRSGTDGSVCDPGGPAASSDFPVADPGGFVACPSETPEIFVAECEPVTCSLPLIAEHFAERLPNQFFVIADKRRNLCVIHRRGDEWTMGPYDPGPEGPADFEPTFERLWQVYYKVLAIPERVNPELQRGNMPKRYWKYLVEQPGNSAR